MGIIQRASLIESQRRLAKLGEIRIGAEKGATAPGRPLEAFRFTSRFRSMLETLAAIHGGEVVPWPDRPGMFQLYSGASSLQAYFSLADIGDGDTESISRNYEYRPNAKGDPQSGKLVRRCNGRICQTWRGKNRVEVPCICAAEGQQLCRIRTRLSVLLPDVPDFGAWQLVTGSQVFDSEIEGFMATTRELVPGQNIIPIRLTITFRHKETAPGDKAGRFPVVLVSRDHAPKSLAQFAGEVRAAILGNEVPQSLGAMPVAPALPVGAGEVIEAQPVAEQPTLIQEPEAPAEEVSNERWVHQLAKDANKVRDCESWLKGEGLTLDEVVSIARKNGVADWDAFMHGCQKAVDHVRSRS